MVLNHSINVAGINFGWDLDKGTFNFEGKDAVIFWISNAMKVFFDTIEEISGEEASNLVFETAGFRQGTMVGEYLKQMNDLEVQELAEAIPEIYSAAGWGQITVQDLNFDTKEVTLHFKDTWEYKINVEQGKTERTNFLPAHCAGVFSILFGTNIWYKVIQQQLAGKECSIVKYFPSDINISNNIHQLARRKETEIISRLAEAVEEKTKELKDLIKKLSSPIIPVLDGIVVVPLIGKYDEERSEDLVVKTLNNLPIYQADYLILDLTGIDKEVDDHTAIFLDKLVSSASLIGIQTILVGISPELSIRISQSGINLSRYDCFQTLQHGIHYALAQMGRHI